MSQHKEKGSRIEKQETAAPREGFMGKAPFAGALLSPDDPIGRMREERQASAGSIILDVVNEAVEAKRAFIEYRRCLMREATRIANTNEHVEEGALKQESAKPANKRDALAIVLSRIAPGATITEERPGRIDNKMSMFSVSWNGEDFRLPIRNSVMEFADPTIEIEKTARALALGWTKEDTRERSLESRRVSRPDCSPLCILQKDLDERFVSYDGFMMMDLGPPHEETASWNMFTYLVRDLETTFAIPSSLTGEDLLREIESKAISVHLAERSGGDILKSADPVPRGKAIPTPASIIEGNASGSSSRTLIDAEESVRKTAVALDHLALTLDLPMDIMPDKYRDSLVRLNALPKPKHVILTQGRRAELDKALLEFADAIEETIGMEGREAKVSTDHEGKICEKALRSLARAYGKMSGDIMLTDATVSELQSARVLMVRRIRSDLAEMEQDGILK